MSSVHSALRSGRVLVTTLAFALSAAGLAAPVQAQLCTTIGEGCPGANAPLSCGGSTAHGSVLYLSNPNAAGHLTLYPTHDPPLVSALNFDAGRTRANNAVIPLPPDETGVLNARSFVLGAGSVHLVVDVHGYFE